MENNTILAKTTLSIKFYEKNSNFGETYGKYEPEMALQIIVNASSIERLYPEKEGFQEYKNYIKKQMYISTRYKGGSGGDFEDNIKVVMGMWDDKTFDKPVDKDSFIENTFNFFEEKLKINKNFIEQKLLQIKNKHEFTKEYFYQLDPRLEINNESIVDILNSIDVRKKQLEQQFSEKEEKLKEENNQLEENLQKKYKQKQEELLSQFERSKNLLAEREKLLEQKEEKLLAGFQTSFKGLKFKNLNDLQAAKFLSDDEKRIICRLLPKKTKE